MQGDALGVERGPVGGIGVKAPGKNDLGRCTRTIERNMSKARSEDCFGEVHQDHREKYEWECKRSRASWEH